MNGKQRAKQERDRKLQKELGYLEWARQKAELKINETARECAVKIVEQHKEMAIKETINVMQYIMAMSLNKEFNFGAGRINKLLKDMRLQMDCVVSGLVSGKDIIDWCTEKGIEL